MSLEETDSDSLSKRLEGESLDYNNSGEWLRVCSRKTKRNLKGRQQIKHSTIQRRIDSLDFLNDDSLETVLRRFDGMRSSFLFSKHNKSFLEGLLKSINQAFEIISDRQIGQSEIDVICLGLGNPAVHLSSLRQLVVLDLLLQSDPRMERSRTHLYDPVFKSVARNLIRKLGMQILQTNKEGCYKLVPGKFYFIMLPHCSPALLNNLLCTNWSPSILSHVVLFCNGWKEVHQELVASGESDSLRISKELSYITALESVVQIPGREYYLRWSSDNKFEEYRDFEGMRVHCFSPLEMSNLPKNIWNMPHSEETVVGTPSSNASVQNSSFYSDLIDANTVPSFVDSITNDCV
ncbi:SRR1-like protein isoform 2 [Schistosoma japonicum]|uniref:SRR1-like protein isoform 2 n=3 Tax=Schistosoma japonicum TaxID=6182 RepID=A0A4Z2DXR1_SCHJA|nr:SRR1-like protein isoform 2 [Schistosoma japonicum]